jgi:hypothetical protein
MQQQDCQLEEVACTSYSRRQPRPFEGGATLTANPILTSDPHHHDVEIQKADQSNVFNKVDISILPPLHRAPVMSFCSSLRRKQSYDAVVNTLLAATDPPIRG